MIAFNETEPAHDPETCPDCQAGTGGRTDMFMEIVQQPESPSDNALASFMSGLISGVVLLVFFLWSGNQDRWTALWGVAAIGLFSYAVMTAVLRRAERRAKMLVKVSPVEPAAEKEAA